MGKKYQVYSDPMTGDYGDSWYTDNPAKAIEDWYKKSVDNPTCVAICAESIEAAQLLIDFAYSHRDLIEEWHSTYKVCYKLQWMLDQIEKKHNDRCSGFLGYLDQVHPFSMG